MARPQRYRRICAMPEYDSFIALHSGKNADFSGLHSGKNDDFSALHSGKGADISASHSGKNTDTAALSGGDAEGCEEALFLTLDEYETIRLMDHEGCTHEQCASIMQISRTTVTEIYASARKKIAAMIVEGRVLRLAGGRVKLCENTEECSHTACSAACRNEPAKTDGSCT